MFNPYSNSYYTPYQQQRIPDIYQPYNRQIGIQGKIIDSMDVVKAIDIPIDGTINYFPLADGSAIITKQVQQDGKSRTIVYKPQIEETPEEVKYITEKDIEDIRGDLKHIKEQIKEISTNKENQ